MPADATQLRHELSIPLNLGPGYYELEVLIAVAGNDANGWTASSFLHFQLTDTELLLVSADEWLRDSRPSDPVGFADDGTAN